MNHGYVKFWRKLQNSPLWLSEKFTRGQAWVDLIALANHKDGFIRIRGQRVNIERGQLAYSELTLAKRWKWSRGKVRRFLSEIESEMEQKIVQQKNNLTTLITIINYEIYQGDGTPNDTTDGHQTDTKRYTNKNDKNEKNPIRDKKIELPEWLDGELWGDFKDHRKKIRKPMTQKAEEILIAKLGYLMNEGHNPKHLILTAIEHGWQTIYPPK